MNKPLTNCPDCNAPLSNYELKERECFGCGWSEHEANITGTLANAPNNHEWDREIDDETMD